MLVPTVTQACTVCSHTSRIKPSRDRRK